MAESQGRVSNKVKHSFNGKSSDVFSTGSIQWKLEYSSNQLLHLSLIRGAPCAEVHYSVQNLLTNSKCNTGKVTVKMGQSVSLGVHYENTTSVSYGYGGTVPAHRSSPRTTVELCVLDSAPIVKIPKELSLLSDISSTLGPEKDLNDVTLYFGQEKEPRQVNKFMLMAQSPVFKAMFQSDFKEAKNSEAKIPDIRPEVGQELITYIYADKAPHISSMTEELWLAADMYDLPRLKALCENELAKQLTLDNAAHTWLFVGQYCGDGVLKDYVLSFITRDKKTCSDVMKTEKWREVEEKFPELLVAVNRMFFDIPSEPAKKKARTS